MKVIRREAFETNSSTSHSIVILSEEDAKRWEEDPNLYACESCYSWFWLDKSKKPEKTKLYTRQELLELLCKEDNSIPDYYEKEEDFFRDEGFVNFEMWENIELEEDSNEFESPSGDKMVAYCKYGTEY